MTPEKELALNLLEKFTNELINSGARVNKEDVKQTVKLHLSLCIEILQPYAVIFQEETAFEEQKPNFFEQEIKLYKEAKKEVDKL